MNEFIEKFAEIFDDMDPATLSGDTNFRELDDWDSIAGLSVIGMVDEEYGVTFGAEDMRACKTIADLYNRVQSKK
ncbi:MAG: acyl carrier protein [Muribaculaceae bacterium]|nr:acyl carrier protein [Muribaculaceae bacterium]MDE5958245.1 acyl carrier protein [Muribaculaceae bacterium]MDE6448372.1 acyl carrier protein [Muribaculaceae bacterium]